MLHSGSRGVGNLQWPANSLSWLGTQYEALLYSSARCGSCVLFPEHTSTSTTTSKLSAGRREYAQWNRHLMMGKPGCRSTQLGRSSGLHCGVSRPINCHTTTSRVRNTTARTVLIHPQGAVRARRGDMGINSPAAWVRVPTLVRAQGQSRKLSSCSHGAGRAIVEERSKAALHAGGQHARMTEGIECLEGCGRDR